jgi:hypothetical protein
MSIKKRNTMKRFEIYWINHDVDVPVVATGAESVFDAVAWAINHDIPAFLETGDHFWVIRRSPDGCRFNLYIVSVGNDGVSAEYAGVSGFHPDPHYTEFLSYDEEE